MENSNKNFEDGKVAVPEFEETAPEIMVEPPKKSSLKWLWVLLSVVLVAGIGIWCGIMANKANGVESTFKFSTTFVMFTLIFLMLGLGYLLGSVNIKGVSLGTAGVFLVAILLGWVCTLDFKDVPLLKAFYMPIPFITCFGYRRCFKSFRSFFVGALPTASAHPLFFPHYPRSFSLQRFF